MQASSTRRALPGPSRHDSPRQTRLCSARSSSIQQEQSEHRISEALALAASLRYIVFEPSPHMNMPTCPCSLPKRTTKQVLPKIWLGCHGSVPPPPHPTPPRPRHPTVFDRVVVAFKTLGRQAERLYCWRSSKQPQISHCCTRRPATEVTTEAAARAPVMTAIKIQRIIGLAVCHGLFVPCGGQGASGAQFGPSVDLRAG